MYKDLGTVLLIGGCGTGKSVFIHKYINEIINEDVDIYIIDPKQVEFYDLKDNRKVVYIDKAEDIQEKLLSKLANKRCEKKAYVFIDEYADIKWCKEANKGIRDLIFNRHDLNIELVVASQIKDTFCTRLKASVDAVITLNSHPRNK
jgi:hypothetical protein